MHFHPLLWKRIAARVDTLRETQSQRRGERGKACRLVMSQIQVVFARDDERGARLLDVEIFLELLLRWLRSVDVMRQRYKGEVQQSSMVGCL